jgi:hypothetical protein
MRAFAALRHPAFVLSVWFLLLLAPKIGHACDIYNLADGRLTIPQVVVGNKIYTNVVVELTLADVQSVGGAVANPAAATFDFYDSSSGLLTVPCVVVGGTTYSNVVTRIDRVISAAGATNALTAPMLWLNFPLDDAVVGQAYSKNLVQQTSPPTSLYTYAIDTLANGSLPPGMTIHFDGTLSGTPFATGATNINGWQVPHTYTFGVCAIDTVSRLSTAPCPQAAVIVRPTRITGSVVGSGTLSPSPAGNSCGPGCIEGFASGTQVTITATPASGWTFASWSGACTGTGACGVSASGTKSVVATFTALPVPAPGVDAVTPGRVTLGSAGSCTGGKLTTTFQVAAANNITWTAAGDSNTPPLGGTPLGVAPSAGNGSGNVVVTITVPPQLPSSSFSSCSLTYKLGTFSNVFITFSDGTVIGVTVFWTFVGTT